MGCAADHCVYSFPFNNTLTGHEYIITLNTPLLTFLGVGLFFCFVNLVDYALSSQDHAIQTSLHVLVLLCLLEVVPRSATLCVFAVLGSVRLLLGRCQIHCHGPIAAFSEEGG